MKSQSLADNMALKKCTLQRFPLETERSSAEEARRLLQIGERMVNEEKVLRMTKMASYEAKEGKKDKAVAGYFRGDYIGMQVIISFLVITVAFLAVFGAYLCLNFEEVMAGIYSMDLVVTGKKLLVVYLVVTGIYLAATYVVYLIRYARARKHLQVFLEYLDCLDDTEEEF